MALKRFSLIKMLDEYEDFNNEATYKVVYVNKKIFHCVPLEIVKNLTDEEEIKNAYDEEAYEFPMDSEVEILGEHLFDFEKAEIEKNKKEFEKLTKQPLTELKKLAIQKEVREIISQELTKKEHEIVEQFEKELKRFIRHIKNDGIVMRNEFLELPAGKLAKYGIKKLQRENWRFCFELNGIYYFQRLLV